MPIATVKDISHGVSDVSQSYKTKMRFLAHHPEIVAKKKRHWDDICIKHQKRKLDRAKRTYQAWLKKVRPARKYWSKKEKGKS